MTGRGVAAAPRRSAVWRGDLLDVIRAGASAVQLYTAMVYEGVSLGARIARELDALLARDGFASVADAVGTED